MINYKVKSFKLLKEPPIQHEDGSYLSPGVYFREVENNNSPMLDNFINSICNIEFSRQQEYISYDFDNHRNGYFTNNLIVTSRTPLVNFYNKIEQLNYHGNIFYGLTMINHTFEYFSNTHKTEFIVDHLSIT